MAKLVAFLPMALLSVACAHADQYATVSENDYTKKSFSMGQENGVIQMASVYSVEDTVARLESALAKRDIEVMAKIDHAANAAGANLELPATTIVIFGDPAAGTQLMRSSPSAGIDLPMKALIYQTSYGVFLEYNDVAYISERHGIPADMPVLSKITALLSALATEATTAN